jgi:putative RNA 2'-phosphotransferase
MLDKEGWADIETLIQNTTEDGVCVFDRAALQVVVDESEKRRFTISEDGKRIRAAQGHSTAQVQMTFDAKEPPAILYHGTAERFMPSIMEEGLKPIERHHVHLSADIKTAMAVGARHGRAVVLEVSTLDMRQHSVPFYQADNGVWLTGPVPRWFLRRLTEKELVDVAENS